MAYEAVLVGTGRLYIAPTGTAYPDVNADPTSPWEDMGETDGGVQVNGDQTIDLHRVDNESGPVKATRSEETLLIVANLAELTLENMAHAFNSNSVTTDAGPPATKTIGLYRGLGTIGERALLFRATGPYDGQDMQFEVPRAIYQGNIGLSFVKDSKTMIQTEFAALVDTTASSDVEKFGRVVAQYTP